MEEKNKKKKIYTQKMLSSMARNSRAFWFENLRLVSRENRALLSTNVQGHYQRKKMSIGQIIKEIINLFGAFFRWIFSLMVFFKKHFQNFKFKKTEKKLEVIRKNITKKEFPWKINGYLSRKRNLRKRLLWLFSNQIFKRTAIASLVILIAVVSCLQFIPSSQGATYAWNQTDWSGGALADTADHTNNRTDWNKYASKDADVSLVNGGAEMQLSASQTGSANVDFNTEGSYVQEDATNGTDFTGGVVQLKNANTTLDLMEYSSDANAQTAYVTNGTAVNTGGTITTNGTKTVHTFTSSGTFVAGKDGSVEYLVVAGGGGGGGNGGGGGGGGGVLTGTLDITLGNKTVIVGSGGANSGSSNPWTSYPGNNSIFDSVTAVGGGKGGTYAVAGGIGGSGGGGYSTSNSSYNLGGSGTVGQGYAGGRGCYTSSIYGGGGGGGAGAAGVNGNCSTGVGGKGGDGIISSISGSSVIYGGGGGGMGYATIGSGGSGGGGRGDLFGKNNAIAGTVNTGGGGGGSSSTGKAGGSGIVIVSYITSNFLSLQSYSESSIKTQGSYSLKGVAATSAVNKTLTRTIASPINLTGIDNLKFDIRSTRTGSNIKIGIRDSGGTITEITPNITSANVFQSVVWNLSGISNTNKDAIDRIIITIVNASAENTFYIDNFQEAYPTSSSYYVTTDTASQINTSSYAHITGLNLTQTTPTNTSIKYLVSFDDRKTWKYWDGDSWEISTLDNLQTNGMEKTAIEAITQNQWESSGGFVGGTTTTLNFAADLKTTDGLVTPELDNISVNYGYYPVTDTSGSSNIDFATEGNYVQQDAISGTDFTGGAVQLSASTVSQYPPVQDTNYVKATSTQGSTTNPWFATNPALSVTGTAVNNMWQAATNTNQRFHIDLGSAKVINKIYYENGHHLGGLTTGGVKNFTFWGSNTGSGTFDDLVYGNDEGWTQLSTSTSMFEEHVASDVADPKYIFVTNSTAYRYYAFKFADDWGYSNMYVRRIELRFERPTSQSYYVTTDTASQINTSAYAHIASVALNQTTPANTSIKYLVSFDNRLTWKYFDGSSWQTTTLTNENLQSYGAEKTTIEAITQSQWEAGGGFIPGTTATLDFAADLKTTDATVTPELDNIQVNYTSAGYKLISSPYNTESLVNVLAKTDWSENLMTDTDVKLQIRTAPDNSGVPGTWTNWLGPDGTTATYFTDPSGSETMPAVFTDGSNDQWMQYKVFLSTTDSSNTPTFSDVNITYAVNAPPEFDATYGTNGTIVSQISNSADDNYGKVQIQYSIRDIDTSTGSFTQDYVTPTFEYTLNGTDWSAVNLDNITFGNAPIGGFITDFNSDGKQDNKVLEGSYLTYIAYWDAKTQINGSYSDTFQIRTTINDNESANNTDSADSAITTLDTKDPILGAHPILVDGSISSNNITLSATDDTTLQMKVGLESNLSDASWESYSASKTLTLATNPETVYVQYRDNFGNTSAILSAATPETPTSMMIQDTSNLFTDPDEYRLFTAWKAITNPTPGFESYKVYRSEDSGGPWTDLQYIITDRTMNYYGDNNVDFDEHYYYKIKSIDADGNVSFLSATIDGKANGIQDVGEGGGGTPSQDPPVISNVEISSINTTQAIVTWDTDSLSNSTVGYSTTPGSFLHETGIATLKNNTVGIGQHSVVLSGLTPASTYYIKAISSDPSNNQGADDNGGPGYSFSTLSGPVISNVTIPEVREDSATISWTTNNASDSYIVYSKSSDLSDSTEIGNADSVTEHEVDLSGLSLGTKYYFYVRSGISIDNNETNYYTLTTESVADTNAPTIGNIETEFVDDASAIITWDTDEASTSQVEYGTTSGSLTSETSLNSNLNLNHSVALVNLTAGTRYYYKVISKDESNNETISAENHFDTEVDPEFQHDALSEISDISDPPSIITDTKAVVTFNTDQAAQCTIEYGTESGNYSDVPFVESDFNENHSMHITGLIFSTQYFYHITCVDNLGNAENSEEYSFTTAEQSSEGETGDVTAPVVSSVKSGTITGESAIINWTTDEETNGSVAFGITSGAYENMAGDYLINSDKENFVTDHSVTINNLVPSTKYYYKVVSVDLSGNIGESSEETFTTKASSSLSSIKVVSTSINEVSITWTTSSALTSEVEYGIDTSYGDSKSSSSKTKEHSVEISGLKSGQVYHFRVKGVDEDNNIYSSGDYTFEPKSPPKISGDKVTSISEHKATLEMNTDVPTDILVTYFDKSDPKNSGSQGKPDFMTKHSLELNNLKAGTTYSYTVRVNDEQGNQTISLPKEFTTGKDETPPEITQVKTDGAIAQNEKVQMIISWTTNEPATTSLIYREGLRGESKEILVSDAYSQNHIVVSTVFKPGTVYNFKVKSVDQADNEVISQDFALLTPRKKENIVQIIVNNFQDIFGWAKVLKK